MPEIRRKKGETFESMLRRFSRGILLSGRLLQAKKVRFHRSSKSKARRKKDALRKLAFRKKQEYLIKVGKVKEEDIFPRRRRR